MTEFDSGLLHRIAAVVGLLAIDMADFHIQPCLYVFWPADGRCFTPGMNASIYMTSSLCRMLP